MPDNIRVRIAPSPTGKFHLGTARTALFNYLFAKRNNGSFILRMEDTDAERSQDQFAKDIIDGLLWLGIGWDEGPEVGGEFGPYYQKERLDKYQVYIDQLLESGAAYKCYCTPEELSVEREKQQKQGLAPKYSGKCRNLSDEQHQQYERDGRTFVIRFKVDPQKVVIDDLIRGKVEYDAGLMGDFVIVRTDGMPLFVFTNTIDDYLMKISHVLRGEEHLPNAAKQILLAEALNFMNPQFGHLPLILNADRSKMSKRKNPVSVTDDYRAKGYLPEALINFLVLLGWSSGTDQEIFSMQELIQEFQIDRVGKSPSIFDPEKLLWMNGYYIRNSDLGKIAHLTQEFITDKELQKEIESDVQRYLQVIALVQDRLKTLADVKSLITFFYRKPEYPASLLIARKSDKQRTEKALTVAERTLREIDQYSVDVTEVSLRKAAQAAELKDGELLWSVRVALSGSEASPGVFELLEIFGKDESLQRIETALKIIKSLRE